MSEVIFCKTRYQDTIVHKDPDGKEYKGYGSYADLWDMVKWANYPLIYVDEIDPQSDNTYIYSPSNIETVNGWPNAKAQIILWQLEWELTEEHNASAGVKRIWSMDKWFADKRGYEYVPMGSDSKLNKVYASEVNNKQYDVAIMSYQTDRRQLITSQLENLGLKLAPISNLWGMERSTALCHSYCMTHTHQVDGVHGVAGLRWALAAAHSLPMITETVHERGIYGYGCMVQSDYEFLAKFTYHMLQDKQRLADYGAALFDLLCVENTFKRLVDKNV